MPQKQKKQSVWTIAKVQNSTNHLSSSVGESDRRTVLSTKHPLSTLDDTDIRILEILQRDAKLTTKEIAFQIDLSVTPVYERIRRLERDGFIKHYVALLDRTKTEKSLIVHCFISLKEHSKPIINKFDRDITLIPEVMECYNIAGQFDYLLKVVVADMNEYQFFMQKLADFDSIVNVQTSFVLREVKYSTELSLR
jgi:Lrp/AsnC family leucine-responsive transcriptional regulator